MLCFCISVPFWCTQAVLFSSFGWHWRAISFRDVAVLLRPFKCVSFSPPCLDHNLLSDITRSWSQLCSRSPLYIYIYICYRGTWPFGPLWWQQGARLDNKNRDFLWALDLKNAIISHQSKQLLAPGAILTHGDTEAVCAHAITTPPTSIPVTVPASGCDLSHHSLYPHTPTRRWWLFVNVDCLPTVHALKEPLALCTLATWRK